MQAANGAFVQGHVISRGLEGCDVYQKHVGSAFPLSIDELNGRRNVLRSISKEGEISKGKRK